MAASNSGGKWLIVLSLGALVVLAMLAQPTEASLFRFYEGPCLGASTALSACGCSNVPGNRRGAYYFQYTGQTAAAYNSPGCAGVAHTRFRGNAGQCTGVGWQSVFIQC